MRSGVSSLVYVCLGLVLGTVAPAGGEPEGLPGCKRRGLGMSSSLGMTAAYRVSVQDHHLGAMSQTQVHCVFQRPAVPYLTVFFLLDGRRARRDAKDTDVRKKVYSAKKSMVCGWVEQF